MCSWAKKRPPYKDCLKWLTECYFQSVWHFSFWPSLYQTGTAPGHKVQKVLVPDRSQGNGHWRLCSVRSPICCTALWEQPVLQQTDIGFGACCHHSNYLSSLKWHVCLVITLEMVVFIVPPFSARKEHVQWYTRVCVAEGDIVSSHVLTITYYITQWSAKECIKECIVHTAREHGGGGGKTVVVW